MKVTCPEPSVLHNIQALRAIAAYLVVIAHLEPILPLTDGRMIALVLGTSGVDLFFVISGFIIVYITAGGEVPPLQFWARRLARIAPLYWLVTLATFFLALQAPSLFSSTTASPDQLIKSLFFVPFEKEPGVVRPLLPVGWTLNYELLYYSIFAACLLLRKVVLAIILSSLVIAVLIIGGSILEDALVTTRFLTDMILLQFVMGMWLGLAFLRNLRLSKRLAWTLLFGAVLALPFAGISWSNGVQVIWAGLPCVAIVWAAVSLEAVGVVLRARAVRSLGAASYALYLTHLFVTQSAVKIGAEIGLTDRPAAAVLVAVLAAIVAGFCALGIHRWIERPVTHALLGRYLIFDTSIAKRAPIYAPTVQGPSTPGQGRRSR